MTTADHAVRVGRALITITKLITTLMLLYYTYYVYAEATLVSLQPYWTASIVLTWIYITLVDLNFTVLPWKPSRASTAVVCQSYWSTLGILLTGRGTASCYPYSSQGWKIMTSLPGNRTNPFLTNVYFLQLIKWLNNSSMLIQLTVSAVVARIFVSISTPYGSVAIACVASIYVIVLCYAKCSTVASIVVCLTGDAVA